MYKCAPTTCWGTNVCSVKAPADAGVRGKVIPNWPTKHIFASVASVVFQHTTLCFLIIALSRMTRRFFPL